MNETEKYDKIIALMEQKDKIISNLNTDSISAEELNKLAKQFHDSAFSLMWCYEKGMFIREEWLEKLQKMFDNMKEMSDKLNQKE